MFYVQIQTTSGPNQGRWQDMDWYETKAEAEWRIAAEQDLDAHPPQGHYRYRIDERVPRGGDESYPV